ncbi:MAG TPA: Crp/Fnr family transcriptional regulator [Gemmatimonadaceae bacterium]|nr:Crp/Fnr family transcriptional regulator [Gemmatimonadaceae bacterium]
MSVAIQTQGEFRNLLLSRIPADELASLSPHLEKVHYGLGTVIIQPDSPVDYVVFPETLIASIVALPNAERIEAVSVGREGFVGFPALLGGTSLTQTIVQIVGEGYRVEADTFVELLETMPKFKAMLYRYIMIVLDETSLTAACNRAHPLNERCAKWLLLVRDRHDESQFLLTHKFLATMLGVRRAGVTVAAGTLQKAGMIRYSRGKVTIVNHAMLEGTACECYEIIRKLQGGAHYEAAAAPPKAGVRRMALI